MGKNVLRILVPLFIFIYSTGCNSSFESADIKSSEDASVTKADDKTVVNSFSNDAVPIYLAGSGDDSLWQNVSYDYETNCLLLTDYKANTLIKEIAFEKGSYVQKTFKFDKGYIVQVAYSDTPVKVEKDDYGQDISFPEKINRCLVRVYDGYLNFRKEINLLSGMPMEFLGRMPYSAVSEDGNKIVWVFLQKLYVCEVWSGKIEKIVDKADNGIYFSQVSFTRDNKNIVYTGSSAQSDEGACIYGLIDLDNKNMTLNVENEYKPGYIQVTTGYAWLCDNIKPSVNTASGKVPILDLQTKKAFTMKVDEAESPHARVTEDGKYLLAVKEIAPGSYRIRQYRLATGEIVNEKAIHMEEGALWAFGLVYSGNSSIYNLISSTQDGKYASYSFDCEEKQAEVDDPKAKVEKYKELAAERNAKPLTEEQKAYEAKQAAIREEIWQDIVDTYDIDTDNYLVLELEKFNAFFNGEIEGFSDKEFLKQVQPIINSYYFSLSEGSIRPFVLIKNDLSEVAVAYKDKDANLHLDTAKKQGDGWEESSDVKEGKGWIKWK